MNSNIYELYQGTTPIRRVYLDDQIVWTLPRYLPPYLASTDIHLASDAFLNPFAIVDGYMLDANEGYGLTNVVNGPISADTFLINRILTEEYFLHDPQSVINELPAEMISRIVEEEIRSSGDLYALDAYGEVFDYDKIHNIFSSLSKCAVGAHGKIGYYEFNPYASITHLDRAIGAYGRIGYYESNPYASIDHLDRGVGAHGRIGYYDFNPHASVTHLDRAVSADSRLFDYVSGHGASVQYENSAISSSGKIDYHTSEHDTTAQYWNRAISSSGKTSKHVSNRITDLSYRDAMVPAAAKNGTRDGTVNIYYNLATSAGNILGGKLIAHDNTTNVTKELSITQGNIGSINRNTNVTVTVTGSGSGSSDTDSNLSLDTMIWLFPQQAGSNLYIPQIYDDGVVVGAVQNGSDLAIQASTFVN